MQPNDPSTCPVADEDSYPILVCVLGGFRLLKAGQPVMLPGGGKAEALLHYLALWYRRPVPRDLLLDRLWPDTDPALAGPSLNSLVYGLRKLLEDAIGGAPPVLHGESTYRLNVEAGIGTDVAYFDALAEAGEQQTRAGLLSAAAACYRRAVDLYLGDLDAGPDIHAIVERERLRGRYLSLLAQLADYAYGERDYPAGLVYAQRLLASDPCREDAHRHIMRCYVRSGQRAQALRQYRVCQTILHAEFEAEPEPATRALFDQIRLNPSSV